VRLSTTGGKLVNYQGSKKNFCERILSAGVAIREQLGWGAVLFVSWAFGQECLQSKLLLLFQGKGAEGG
jgi:hypothetical protein